MRSILYRQSLALKIYKFFNFRYEKLNYDPNIFHEFNFFLPVVLNHLQKRRQSLRLCRLSNSCRNCKKTEKLHVFI